MTFRYEEYKKWELKNQFSIPRRLEYIAHRFGNEFTYNEITEFYAISVREVLMFYNVKVLSETPWGVGFLEVQDRWVEKMNTCLKRKEFKKKFKEADDAE
jgi:hypothetical protein